MILADAWRLALGTLTAVPVGAPSTVDARRARLAMTLGPVAALPLGAAAAGVITLGWLLDLPDLVTAVAAIAVLALGTRCLHLDGLSDVADGLTASYEPQRSLDVMKSGTSGPAGVVATVLALMLQVTALAAIVGELDPLPAAVLAGCAVALSRTALLLCCAKGVPAARGEGLGLVFAGSVPRPVVALAWVIAAVLLGAVGAWAGLAWWRGALAIGLALLVVLAVIARAVRRLGGVTGDVFGAGVELSLTAILVALA